MKIAFALNAVLGSILFVSTFCCCTSCLANEGEVKPRVGRQLVELEEMWAVGKTDEYCRHAANLAKDIVAGKRDAESVGAAATLLEGLLAKESTVKDSEVGVLAATEGLAFYIAKSDKEITPDRQKLVPLLARYLGHVRNERVPDFRPLHVVANVSPPAGVPGFAGMNPDAISDPVAKSNYLKAIQENRQNNLTNRRQALLERVERRTSRPIMEYMVSTIRNGGVPTALVAEWVNSARLNEKEREEVQNSTISK